MKAGRNRGTGGCFRASITSIRLQADGRTHAVSAQALGFAAHPPDSPPGRLARSLQARAALMDDQAPPFVPTAVRLYAETSGMPDPGPAGRAWPVPSVDLLAVPELP